jgi:hypothetical protein
MLLMTEQNIPSVSDGLTKINMLLNNYLLATN